MPVQQPLSSHPWVLVGANVGLKVGAMLGAWVGDIVGAIVGAARHLRLEQYPDSQSLEIEQVLSAPHASQVPPPQSMSVSPISVSNRLFEHHVTVGLDVVGAFVGATVGETVGDGVAVHEFILS